MVIPRTPHRPPPARRNHRRRQSGRKIMPWTMARRQKQIDAAKATPEEIDKALAELDEEIIITNVETT